MKLLRMTATFGCLNQETLELRDGFNLIYAPNGRGKSTWCAFLRVMLYGLDTRSRDKKGMPAEKNRYRPWNGAPMEGLLECEHQSQRILIRRTTAGNIPMGEFSAVYARTGRPVPGLTAANVGEKLTGVGREVFERSAFIRQTGLAVDQSQELEKRIAALVSSGQEDVSWSQADSRLREWQRKRQFHKNGQIPRLEEEETSLQSRISQQSELRQEITRLREEIRTLRRRKSTLDSNYAVLTQQAKEDADRHWAEAVAELDAAEQKVEALQTEQTQLDEDSLLQIETQITDLETRISRRGRGLRCISGLGLFLSGLGVLFAAWPAMGNQIPLPFLLGGIGCLGLLISLLNLNRIRKDTRDTKTILSLRTERDSKQEAYRHQQAQLEAAVAERDQANKLFQVVSGQTASQSPAQSPEAISNGQALSRAENQLSLLLGQQTALGDPAALEAELAQVRTEKAMQQEDFDALSMAVEALTDADQELQSRFSPILNTLAGDYFARLTGGTYERLTLSRDLEAQAEEPNSLTPRPAAVLSQGTADQLYLAVRLAVSDLILPQEEPCPLILDDALTSFDDDRLLLALQCIQALSETRQVLLFTCHGREPQALKGRGFVHFVSL